MNSRKRLPRHGLSPTLLDSWEEINPLSLPEDKRQNFYKRVLAIRLYAAGESIRMIDAQTGIKKQQLFYFAKRCTSPNGNGAMSGFVALIPGRQGDTNRANDQSLLMSRMPKPGALAALFEKYPDIHTAMKEAVLEGKRKDTKLVEKAIPLWSLYQYFLNLCAEAGIRGPHYPFCSGTDSDGKPAIYRWVKKLRTGTALSNLRTAAESVSAKDSLLELEQVLRRQAAIYCYRRVECDGHKIDVPIVLERPSPTGEGVIHELINRIWIIALIEAKSDAAIGYALAIGSNYSGTDVIRAVESSLKPWSPRQLTIKSIGYRDGDGIPNGIIQELAYVCFDELWLDNFMAQRSEFVLSAIERVVKAVPVYSPVASPNSHPWVEGFFNILEEAGIHRLPTTTGSNPNDKRRNKSPKLSYHLTYDELADVIDVLVCRINGLEAPGRSESRLAVLRNFATKRKTLIRRIPVETRESIFEYDMYEEGSIGRDHGCAVIRFHGARYCNQLLKHATGLIGRNVLVLAHSKRLRRITALLEDGVSLGELLCERRYQQTEHGLETRRAIKKLEKQGALQECDDIVVGTRRHLEQKAKLSRSEARLLLRLQQEQAENTNDKNLIPSQPEEDVIHPHLLEADVSANLDADSIAAAEELLRNITTRYR